MNCRLNVEKKLESKKQQTFGFREAFNNSEKHSTYKYVVEHIYVTGMFQMAQFSSEVRLFEFNGIYSDVFIGLQVVIWFNPMLALYWQILQSANTKARPMGLQSLFYESS